MTSNLRNLTDAAAIEARILDFLARELLDGTYAIDRETDLLSGDVLDSMSVLRLAVWVGDAFAISVEASDFVIENFRSVAALGDFVRRRVSGVA